MKFSNINRKKKPGFLSRLIS